MVASGLACLVQWFSNGTDFVLSGHLALSRDIFLCQLFSFFSGQGEGGGILLASGG